MVLYYKVCYNSVCLNGWVTLDLNVHFISWKLKLNLALFCNDFKIKTRIKNKFFFFDNLFLSISIKSILFLFLLFFLLKIYRIIFRLWYVVCATLKYFNMIKTSGLNFFLLVGYFKGIRKNNLPRHIIWENI